MVRGLSVAVILASLVVASAETTHATTPVHPSDRACLLAWNSPANHENRLRVLAQRPISGLRLLAGEIVTDTVTKGSTPTQTSAPACLLTLAKPGNIRIVSGTWKGAGVSSWSFGRPVPTSKPFFANVRLLSDGRVTKIYRH